MQRLACFAAAFAPMAPLAAQFVPAATAGGIGVHAGSVFAAVPAPGSDVWPGLVRDAVGTTASAHLGIGRTLQPGAVVVDWSLITAAGGGSSTAAGEGDVRYEFWSSAPIVGTVTVAWGAMTSGTGAASCSIDLGDDGIVEATGTATLAVVLGAGEALRLHVHAGATAVAGTQSGPFGTSWSWSGSAQAALQVRFEPTPASVTALSNACGGPWLGAASNLMGGVDFTGSLPAANDLALLVLGLAPLPVPAPLPWSACGLAVEPALVLGSPVVAGQNPRWSVAVPFAVRPATVCAQVLGLDLDAVVLTSSQAIAAALP